MKTLITITLVLAILVTGVAASRAQADMGFKGVGGKLSYVNLTESVVDIGSALSLEAIAGLGNVTPSIEVEGYLKFWSKSETFGTAYGYDAGTWTLRDVAIGARGKYMFAAPGEQMRPFVGGGLGLHFFNSSWEADGRTGWSVGESKLGIDIGGGVSYAFSPNMDFVAEGWYTGTSIDQLSIGAGVSYWLGR